MRGEVLTSYDELEYHARRMKLPIPHISLKKGEPSAQGEDEDSSILLRT